MLVSDIDFCDVTFVWEKDGTIFGWKVTGLLPDTSQRNTKMMTQVSTKGIQIYMCSPTVAATLAPAPAEAVLPAPTPQAQPKAAPADVALPEAKYLWTRVKG